jgi:tryptophan-rich sensory protein
MISKREAFTGSVVIILGIAITGARFSTAGAWYESIKPTLAPPNFVFGIVWAILYILIAISLGLSIIAVRRKPYTRKLVYTLFTINLLTNVLWSFIFFVKNNISLALVDILIMDITAIILILSLYKINKIASILLMPYALWILFATLLNILIFFG